MNSANKVKLSVISIFFIIFIFSPFASGYPDDEIIIYNASGDIAAAPGETAVAVIGVEIHGNSYIYANPKGEGIGKATEVTIEKSRMIKSWEARYPGGEKYQAGSDTGSVNIYRKKVRIPVAFVIEDSITSGHYMLKADISVLMCSSSMCLPVDRVIEIPVDVRKGKTARSPSMINNMNEFFSLRGSAGAQPVLNEMPVHPAASDENSVIPESINFNPIYPDGGITGLIEAIIFGLIAGFILNFMPCVLPVVSLKIMSFVMNAGEKKRTVITQGLLFSAGIISSFLILASLAAFSGHKWGTLFQNKMFIIIMTSFIFSMALSLFGVFVFNIPFSAGKAVSKTRGIYSDAFIKGAVATLLATPCSGPFLGGTLAWALTRPPEIIFVIFISVGIGMALPYMLLAFNPSLLKVVPKPGIWMNHFETAMGFLLMFTVVYLLGILDASNRMSLILFLMFLALGLWQFGILGSIDRERWKRRVSFILLLVILFIGYSLSFSYFYREKNLSHERTEFSIERILKNRDKGIITVVEFTADWCPNCSMVEKLALEKEQVQEIFSREDVEFMVAHITQKNPQAESLMNRLGSKSIPLLAIFPPGDGFVSPLCLRDIYSAGDVTAAIKSAEKFKIK